MCQVMAIYVFNINGQSGTYMGTLRDHMGTLWDHIGTLSDYIGTLWEQMGNMGPNGPGPNGTKWAIGDQTGSAQMGPNGQ